ncbi:DUF4817 domain-containing protein [Trichonephila clavipes]|nr:DUF4817 domain-containing protein [Trichonephila clavipes]
MAGRVKKAQCVAWFTETKSDTQTQRNYRTTYGESPPSRSSIPYKVQILHAIKPDDYAKRYGFAVDMLHRLVADEHFLNRILFSDESTFHVSGMVNKHNVRFWGSEQPHAVRELQRSSEKLYGSFSDTLYNLKAQYGRGSRVVKK